MGDFEIGCLTAAIPIYKNGVIDRVIPLTYWTDISKNGAWSGVMVIKETDDGKFMWLNIGSRQEFADLLMKNPPEGYFMAVQLTLGRERADEKYLFQNIPGFPINADLMKEAVGVNPYYIFLTKTNYPKGMNPHSPDLEQLQSWMRSLVIDKTLKPFPGIFAEIFIQKLTNFGAK
jgi:hypothetical protein